MSATGRAGGMNPRQRSSKPRRGAAEDDRLAMGMPASTEALAWTASSHSCDSFRISALVNAVKLSQHSYFSLGALRRWIAYDILQDDSSSYGGSSAGRNEQDAGHRWPSGEDTS